MTFELMRPRLESKQQTIDLREAIARAARPKMRPVWRHYFSRKGTPRDLRSFNLDQNFLRHSNVRDAENRFKHAIVRRARDEIRFKCGPNQSNENRQLRFSFRDSIIVNVNSDLDLTLIGNGTIHCDALVMVQFNCKRKVFTIETALRFSLEDAFVDVRDLESNIPGNQEIPPGVGFDLTFNWSKGIELPAVQF